LIPGFRLRFGEEDDEKATGHPSDRYNGVSSYATISSQ